MWSPDKCPHSTCGSSSTTFIKWIYRELRKTTSIWKGPLYTHSKKNPHQEKNDGFFLMRFLKIETKCSQKESTGQVLATQTAEKGGCFFFLRKGILSTKRRLWTNPRIFHTFFGDQSRHRRQQGSWMLSKCVSKQGPRDIGPSLRSFGRFQVPHWWCYVSHTPHTRHQPRNVRFLCIIGW